MFKEKKKFKFSILLNYAQVKQENVENGIKDFQAYGLIPFNSDTIPHYVYLSEVETEVKVYQSTEKNVEPQLT